MSAMNQGVEVLNRVGAIAGFQPTGDGRLHLGNLLGSALPFASYKASGVKYAMVADVHALSMGKVPEGFGRAKSRMLRELAACGVGDGAVLFEQSKVIELLALGQMLAPFAPMGELRRMTQFESKAGDAAAAPLALLGYPCLMAADILALGALDVVVGEDQRQHLELARGISNRIKMGMGVDLGQPRAIELTAGVRVKSLRNPESKMSKSDLDEGGTIYLSDSRADLTKKIRRAVTDAMMLPRVLDGELFDEQARLGVASLLSIIEGVGGGSAMEVLGRLGGQGHSALKELAIESVDAALSPIRDRLAGISDEEARRMAKEGSEIASARARKTLARLMEALDAAGC